MQSSCCQNKRLPPTMYPFWSYNLDSFGINSIQYNNNLIPENPNSFGANYLNYVRSQLKTPNSLMTRPMGMSYGEISYLEDQALNFPDVARIRF